MSTDPLAEWTLERDASTHQPCPHRLRMPDGWTVWLPDFKADQIERAKDITAAWAAGDEAQRCPEHPSTCDGSDPECCCVDLHRPALPGNDLPEGVHRIDADTLVARGIDIPEGWDFYGPAESLEASEDESRPWWDWRDREADVRTGHVVYVVRRRPTPPPPAVERVPWWEALGRRSPHNRRPITVAEHDGERVVLRCATTDPSWHPDADGTVEVLRQDGAE